MSPPSDIARYGSGTHLKAGGAALVLLVAALSILQIYVEHRLPAAMPAFASRTSPIKLTGNVLQSQAFRLADSLPIYGSSELDRKADNRPDAFFRERPTGFTAFPIGRGGTTCLLILQKLAAAGLAARGKKAVVFLSPGWFVKEEVSESAVSANLTPTLLGGWIFADSLSLPLKTQIARRLLDYPDSLEKQPLLRAAVNCLREPTPFHRVVLVAINAFGRAQNAILRYAECGAILREITVYGTDGTKRGMARRANVTAPPTAHPNWAQLAQMAEAKDRARHDGTAYSARTLPPTVGHPLRTLRTSPKGSRDEQFVERMMKSKEWDDLGLLVLGLKELGVDALFISQPFNGVYRDMGGTSPKGRNQFYTKLEATLRAADFTLLDFSDHEEDRFFFNDTGHPSAKAWIFYDEGIDHFYHRRKG